jgi:hypothetical protein
MTRHGLIMALTLSVTMPSPLAGEAGRNTLTSAQIASAISSAGMQISADQVTLLSDVVAKTSTPNLKVQAIERMPDGRMRVRLDCGDTDQCVPFFVIIHVGESAAPGSASVAAVRTGAANPGSKQPYNSFTIRAGAPAILLLDGSHVHIKVAVVCLENGSTGQAIRVSSQDRRQTYTAEVVDGTTLRGTL